MIFRKITLRPTFAEPAINFPVALRLLRNGLVDGNALVTRTFGFADRRAHRAPPSGVAFVMLRASPDGAPVMPDFDVTEATDVGETA